ncbi:hypothetical protein [Leuconostoc mesenteroides]|uniref:hypothetical protein n=1 Tax=Leuconostoc mesenteroides TaxID=1245 RepID=UPI00236143A3|nr:hypothetical protein [Leuconostoc mesenteroides]
MSEFMGVFYGCLVAGGLYLLDRFLPKWFGALPGIAYFIFMIWLMIYKNGHNVLGLFTVLIVGEAIINGIWIESIESRKKKTQKELDKMKAKDLS